MPLEIHMGVVSNTACERIHKNDEYLERYFVFKPLVFSLGPCQLRAVFGACKYLNNSQ